MASKEEWIMSTENKSRFTALQIRLLIALGSVVGLQTLSMTMLNSFVDLYGETLRWNTPLLCGLALGIYGLANAAFQIPYGSLSDRKGRRPVIMMGLLLLSAGLFIGFLAHDIYSLILSRAMQGCGAIQGIAYSWINDGVEDDKKSRAMSLAGIIVAIGGVGAFVGGPLLYNIMPVRYMFLICAALIFLTFLYILFFIKENRIAAASLPVSFGKQMRLLLKDKAVVFLSLCGFVNQYIFTVVFLVVPKEVNTLIGAGRMWMIFLPAILIGILAMRITAAASDKGHYVLVAAGSFLLMFLGWLFLFRAQIAAITIGTILNMTGYMCLTAGVPSQVNKLVRQESRGAANGILQAFTYLGLFFGPTVAGYLIGIHLNNSVNILSMLLALFAAILSAFCAPPFAPGATALTTKSPQSGDSAK